MDWDGAGNKPPTTLIFWARADAKDQNGFLLYKYAPGSLVLNALNYTGGVNGRAVMSGLNWAQGTWHHVAWTWLDGEGVKLYVDGRCVSACTALPIRYAFTKLEFGPVGWGEGHTAIDDFAIYRRPLSAEEVQGLRQGVGAPSPRPLVHLDYLRLDQRVVVRVYSPSEPVRVEVKSEGHGNILAQQTLKQLRHGWGEAEFDVASLPLGRYRVQAGGAQARFEKDTNATWTDAAKLGKLDGVLPPWTPLQRPDEHTIVVWGRRIVLDENQLPRSIRCLGTELLAAPVQLRGGPAKVSLCADYDGFLKSTAGEIREISCFFQQCSRRGAGDLWSFADLCRRGFRPRPNERERVSAMARGPN